MAYHNWDDEGRVLMGWNILCTREIISASYCRRVPFVVGEVILTKAEEACRRGNTLRSWPRNNAVNEEQSLQVFMPNQKPLKCCNLSRGFAPVNSIRQDCVLE